MLRILEYHGGNYILIGKEGLGKKTMFKMAALLVKFNWKSAENVEESKIAEFVFDNLKECLIKDK